MKKYLNQNLISLQNKHVFAMELDVCVNLTTAYIMGSFSTPQRFICLLLYTHLSLFDDIQGNEKFKDTCYLWGKNSKNPQLLDILACNSANNPSFWKGFLSEFEKMVH